MNGGDNTQYFNTSSELFFSSSESDCTLYFNAKDCASSTNHITPANVGQTKVSQPHGNKNKEKPKAMRKIKKVITNDKLEQGEATLTYWPQQFIGLYVNLEYKGARSLATVISYSHEKNLFKVEFKLRGKPTVYVERNELLYNMAKSEHFVAENSWQTRSKKASTGKKKKHPAREGPTPTKERRNTSSQKKKAHYVALRIRASNA